MGTELQTIELSTPGKDIESYLSSVHSIPILTPVQERELAQKLYDNDDLDAARQLVLAHLRFVVHISRTYSGYGLPLADIIGKMLLQGDLTGLLTVLYFLQYTLFHLHLIIQIEYHLLIQN